MVICNYLISTIYKAIILLYFSAEFDKSFKVECVQGPGACLQNLWPIICTGECFLKLIITRVSKLMFFFTGWKNENCWLMLNNASALWISTFISFWFLCSWCIQQKIVGQKYYAYYSAKWLVIFICIRRGSCLLTWYLWIVLPCNHKLQHTNIIEMSSLGNRCFKVILNKSYLKDNIAWF